MTRCCSPTVTGLLASLLICAGFVAVSAQETSTPRAIVVVVSSENPVESLSAVQVRRLFLREQDTWPNGWPVAVFERSANHPIRAAFSSVVLRKSPGQLSEYWLNLSLTRGLEPPKVSPTAALLKQYLNRVKGGIGYVYEDEIGRGMKVVARVRGTENR